MRLIDADALIKCIPPEEYNSRFAVMNAPTVEPKKWIPCSERLPEQGQEVICQCIASIIKVLKLNANGDWYQAAGHCYMSDFVIAWMPLPELWKGENHETD